MIKSNEKFSNFLKKFGKDNKAIRIQCPIDTDGRSSVKPHTIANRVVCIVSNTNSGGYAELVPQGYPAHACKVGTEMANGPIVERCILQQLLARQRRKGFQHRIVTGDEKWVRYDNPKRRKSWGSPGHASTSTAKPNIHGSKHDNARAHVAKVVKTYLGTLKWEVLPHPLSSPDLSPSDYHLFRSMTHGLADQHFRSYEEVKNWIDLWIASKDNQFFQHGIRTLPERWEKVVASDGQYFES
ncbi:mariner Mos1 transposase [Trichonephila clavipes]|nr:mariner Mos1 transposase [Trichonephila clavipes]